MNNNNKLENWKAEKNWSVRVCRNKARFLLQQLFANNFHSIFEKQSNNLQGNFWVHFGHHFEQNTIVNSISQLHFRHNFELDFQTPIRIPFSNTIPNYTSNTILQLQFGAQHFSVQINFTQLQLQLNLSVFLLIIIWKSTYKSYLQ